VPMVRPSVTPSRLSMLVRRLGCASALLRRCATGWLDVDDRLNCGMSSADRRRRRRVPEVSVDGLHLLAGTGAVAAQAVLILINGGGEHGHAVRGADPGHVLLRDANERCRWKHTHRLRAVARVAIHARGMAVVLSRVFSAASCGLVEEGNGWPTLGEAYSGKTLA